MPAAEAPIRIVVAEDEAIIRLDLKETLESEGYEVAALASRGTEALEIIRTHKPDLAILDIQMPEMDGLNVASAINSENICGVIILTAYSQKELISRAGEAGVLSYLVKPFEKAELVAAVEIALMRFSENQALLKEGQKLSERLEGRKFIDKAKGLLMDKYGMNEADAFSFLQKKAMDQRKTMKYISEKIMSEELKPEVSSSNQNI